MAENGKRQEMSRNKQHGAVAKARKGRRLWVIFLIMAIAATAFLLVGWMRRPAAGDLGAARATFTARRDELCGSATVTVR